jgi:non-specific protein-tyrosine kinase
METIDLRDYILPLRRWWWLIAAAMLVAGASNYYLTPVPPTVYRSHATVMVGGAFLDPNPDSAKLDVARQLVDAYVDLIQRESIRVPTMAALGMNWLPGYSAEPVPDTQLIELTVVDSDPARAQAVLWELIRQLIRVTPTNARNEEYNQVVVQQLDDLQANILATKSEIEDRRAELGNLFGARQLADAEAQITTLEAKLVDLQLAFAALLSATEEGAVNTLIVVEEPGVGAPIVGRKSPRQALLAVVIGFLLAAAGAYLLEYLDNTFRNSDEVRARLNLATLGAIPGAGATAGKDGGLVMLTDAHSPTAESFRVLRTNLQFSAVARLLGRVLVTSPLPGEGKSFISANLAVAAAQTGLQVILVDCDLHRPSQHKYFELSETKGLTSALLAAELVDPIFFLQATAQANLRVLTSGPLPPNTAELAGSQRLRDVLDRLQQEADLVVLDSPPAAVLSDTAVLTTQADGVLLVLEVGRTSRDLAHRTLAALQQVQAHVAGVVLNRIPLGGAYLYPHLTRDSRTRGSARSSRPPCPPILLRFTHIFFGVSQWQGRYANVEGSGAGRYR